MFTLLLCCRSWCNYTVPIYLDSIVYIRSVDGVVTVFVYIVNICKCMHICMRMGILCMFAHGCTDACL